MPMKSPTVRHRRLGRDLRQLREQAGLLADEAARRLGWSPAKISRIENARTAPSVTDVSNACDLYGADSATKAGLIELCREAGQRGWWTAYSDVFTGSYIALEAEAKRIRMWEPLLIPGLLQSEGYAREVISSGRPDLSKPEVQRRVDARMIRKLRMVGPSAPTLHAVIDEAVFQRPLGGSELMKHQLDDILQVVDWPNIIIQVLPIRAPVVVASMEGRFCVMSFGDSGDPDVGYAEGPAGEVYVEADGQVRRLMLLFERLADVALSPEESAAFIAAARSEHDFH
ncbi:helix-turn-helix transcriptional regulator [Streptosporangium sp. NPDC020072]|uniref:helix-turn-helix domain-containing protein n=1 Tax=Streptosporangium sp. NPDC020072 TaxID=3154788 RepID=UPI00342E450C